jgi:hypothetical protein
MEARYLKEEQVITGAVLPEKSTLAFHQVKIRFLAPDAIVRYKID